MGPLPIRTVVLFIVIHASTLLLSCPSRECIALAIFARQSSSSYASVARRRRGCGVDDDYGVRRACPPPLASSAPVDDDGGNVDDDAAVVSAVGEMRRRASELRAEASAAEMAIRGTRTDVVVPASSSSSSSTTSSGPVEYAKLGGSCWEMTYRFANEPESVVGVYAEGGTIPATTITRNDRLESIMYGGKVRMRFRDDGYSDILTTTADADVGREDVPTFVKVWGWDLEADSSSSTSSTIDGGIGGGRRGGDGNDSTPAEYLLFSADVRLPPPISAVQRFYFQAIVTTDGMGGKEDDGCGVISLRDGTVSVKRDVVGPGGMGGWWGVFRGANSILAEFRKVGEFRCRPIPSDA